MMVYPDSFFRGISNKEDVDQDGILSAAVFLFTDKKNAPLREDDYKEESISWKDDDAVLDLVLNQKKESGEIQFKVGVVEVQRNEVDRLKKMSHIKDYLSYERNVDEPAINPYHGNLLLKKHTPSRLVKHIASMIAGTCPPESITLRKK